MPYGILVIVAAILGATTPAAALDATGRWVLHSNLLIMPVGPDAISVENWVQSGSVLTTDTGYAGTISSVSGAFVLGRPNPSPCPGDGRAGTVALSGNTFTALEDLHPLVPPDMCGYGALSVTGTRCPSGTIEPGEECDDGNADPGDGCDGTCRIEACYQCSGAPSVCTHLPSGTPCTDDGFACTADTCEPPFGCVHSPLPGTCDDNRACTVDSCQPGLGCVNTPDLRSCRSARSSTLRVRSTPDEPRDKLIWRWTQGQSTSTNDFADPRLTADYTFCLFAGNGTAVVGEASVPPDPVRWYTRINGFRYRDRTRSKAGIKSIVLVGSVADRARVVVKGGGAELAFDSPPLSVPLTAQLVNRQTNACWSATYDATDLRRNDAGELKGRATTP